jgi:hypothetical protein
MGLGSFIKGAIDIVNPFDSDVPEVKQKKLIDPFQNAKMSKAQAQSTAALRGQQDFLNALKAQGGVSNQANVFGQQQALAKQLGLMAQGKGPSVAQAQLNQTTGQNVANQAALMAGMRGAGANPALMARQIAQQGAATQQQAAGQGAALRAQEQLAAINALQQQQGMLGNLATQQVGQQQQATSGMTAAQQAQQQMLQNMIANQNSAISGQNAAALQAAQAAQASENALTGSLLGAGAGLLGTFMGPKPTPTPTPGFAGNPLPNIATAAHGGIIPGKAPVPGDHPVNDKVPAVLSPGEIVIPRSVVSSDDPIGSAAKFVAEVLAKESKEKTAYADGGMVAPPSDSPILDAIMGGGLANSPQARSAIADKFSGAGSSILDTLKTGLLKPPTNYTPPGASMATPAMQTGGDGVIGNMPGLTETPAAPLPAQPAMPMAAEKPKASLTQSALNETLTGIKKQAEAEAALGQQKQDILNQQVEEQQKQAATYQANFERLNAKRAQLEEDINTGKIDPNRYINSMSGGQKVANAIGIILGGLGQGLAGGENVAMKLLQKQIDADVDAQKSELGKKQNLLSANMQEFNNLQDATNMTRAMSADIVARQLDQAAAAATDPLVKARAQEAAGKLRLQYADAMEQTALRQTMMGQTQSGALDPARAISMLVPKEQQEEALKELSNINAVNDAALAVNDTFDSINKIRLGGKIPFTKEKAMLDAANTNIISRIKQSLKGQGSFTDKDQETVESLLANGSDTDAIREVKRQGLQDFLAMKKEGGAGVLKAYNINPKQVNNKLTTKEARMLDWAKQNPTSPVAQDLLKTLASKMQ